MENDLISRSAVLFVLGNEYFPTKGEFARAMDFARFAIQDVPAVDAVKVVRCKDCKHKRHLQGATDEAIVCGLGWGLSGIVVEEDFCSYGEKRSEEYD